MKPQCILTGALLLLCPTAFTACGSDPQLAPTYSVSVGQQIRELDQARQEGLLSEREYKALKKALIKRYD